jgi:hypothetical protein
METYKKLALLNKIQLEIFKDQVASYPTQFNSLDEWKDEISKMIYAFSIVLDYEDIPLDLNSLVVTGLNSYSKNFLHLWI